MLNIGLDYAFFDGRINGSIEYYDKNTKDLIWNYPVSSFVYPYSTIVANVGEISNRGIEFSINAIPVRNQNFTWTTTLNLSHNKNKVKKLTNEKYSTAIFTQGDSSPTSLLVTTRMVFLYIISMIRLQVSAMARLLSRQHLKTVQSRVAHSQS